MLSQFRCCWYNPRSGVSGYCGQCPQSAPHVDNSNPSAGHARLPRNHHPATMQATAHGPEHCPPQAFQKQIRGRYSIAILLYCAVLISTAGRDTASNRSILKNSGERAQENLDPAYPTPKLRRVPAVIWPWLPPLKAQVGLSSVLTIIVSRWATE